MTQAVTEHGVRELFEALVRRGTIYDLSHPLTAGMPVFPAHAPFTLTLHRRHGDRHDAPRPGRSSFANEVIVMPGHAATHIDALGHFSRDGKVHGGGPAGEIETHRGLCRLDAAEIAPIWRRGVLLDVATYCGVEVLEPGQAVGADELRRVAEAQGTRLEHGDVVLVRTGWARHWSAPQVFNGGRGGFPGPDAGGARWLVEHGARIVGSDTPAFEAIPFPGDSVHALLLVDHGVHIIENLNLEEIARDRVREFLFVGLPLRLAGATGAPFRPIAVA